GPPPCLCHFPDAPLFRPLALETREDAAATRERLAPLDHRESHLAALAERSMMAAIGGDCRAPVAALARLSKGFLEIEGLVADPSDRKSTRLNSSPLGISY